MAAARPVPAAWLAVSVLVWVEEQAVSRRVEVRVKAKKMVWAFLINVSSILVQVKKMSD
jgi:hypothetical protein